MKSSIRMTGAAVRFYAFPGLKNLALVLIFLTGIFSVFAKPQAEGAASPLRVGIMPDADSLPLMIARDRGFFEAQGVAVELVIFSNPQERDAALQADRLDGSISDLLAAAFFAAGGFNTKVTSLTDGRYGIVAAPKSGLSKLTELRGKRIGLSANSIIQYTVDAQLESAGIPYTAYEAVAVPRMPLRLQMVLEGQIDGASLPEPLLTAAVAQGALLLSTTDTAGIDAGILLFSKKVLDTRLEDVRRFYRAYDKAAQAINVDNDAYRDYLVEKAAFPQGVRDAYRFVRYRKPGLPAEAQVTMALNWLRSRGLLTAELGIDQLLDGRAVAEWQ